MPRNQEAEVSGWMDVKYAVVVCNPFVVAASSMQAEELTEARAYASADGL